MGFRSLRHVSQPLGPFEVLAADSFSFVIDLGVDLHLQPSDVNLNRLTKAATYAASPIQGAKFKVDYAGAAALPDAAGAGAAELAGGPRGWCGHDRQIVSEAAAGRFRPAASLRSVTDDRKVPP